MIQCHCFCTHDIHRFFMRIAFSRVSNHSFLQLLSILILTCIVVFALYIFSRTSWYPPFGIWHRTLLYDYGDFAYYFEMVSRFFGGTTLVDIAPRSSYPPLFFLLAVVLRSIIYFTGGDFFHFIILFQILMGLAFGGTLLIASAILEILNRSKAWLWLLFLPSSLYFIFYRFDILVALTLLVSIRFLIRKQFFWSLVFLALSALLKWHTAFLAPLYFFHLVPFVIHPTHQRDIIRGWCAFFGLFFATHFFVGLIFGWDMIFDPYILQLYRSSEVGSFFAALFGGRIYSRDPIAFSGVFALPPFFNELLSFVFGIVRFLPLAFLPLWFVRQSRVQNLHMSTELFLLWGCLILMNFVLWNNVYSNQWILWFLPLLLFVLSRGKELLLVIVFDILNYLQFPFFYERLLAGDVWSFQALVFVRSEILLWLVYRMVLQITQKQKYAFVE